MSHWCYNCFMKIIRNINTKKEFIRTSNVNSVFSNDITEICELLLYEKGDFLIKEGRIQNYLLFLVKGEVIMTILSHKGFDFALGGSHTFEVYGEASALWGEIPENSIWAATDSYCLGIHLGKYRSLLLNDARFLTYIAQLLSKRLKKLSKNILTQIESNAENVLAAYILQNQKNNVFTSKLTITAEAVGISYRHLIRLLNSLCERNLLKKDNRRYFIIDHAKLTELSNKAYRFYS